MCIKYFTLGAKVFIVSPGDPRSEDGDFLLIDGLRYHMIPDCYLL